MSAFQLLNPVELVQGIAQLRAEAAEKEIDVLGDAVASLYDEGSLAAYLQRRRDEAATASKTLYRAT